MSNKDLVLESKTKKKHVPLTLEFIKEHVLEEQNFEVAFSLVQRKIIAGAKGSSKTFPELIRNIWIHENFPWASSWAFSKYKEGASKKLGDYYHRALKELSKAGYKTKYDYNQKRNNVFITFDKKNDRNNSSITFGGLDTPDVTSGNPPSNGGYVTGMLGDEPIIKKEMLKPETIPTPEEWYAIEDQIFDDLDRYHDPFLKDHPNAKIPPFQMAFCLNKWGEHPLAVELEKYFPQNDFVKTITGYDMEELYENKELLDRLVYSESGDILESRWAELWLNPKTAKQYKRIKHENSHLRETLYVNSTKFSNPFQRVPSKARIALKNIHIGFLTRNLRLLAHYAGLQFYAEQPSELRTYNIQNYNNASLEELKKLGFEIDEVSYGIDIDSSRVFTIAPAYSMIKYQSQFNGEYKKIKHIHIAQIKELPAMGSGEFGELHEIQAKMIAGVIKKDLIRLAKENEYIRRTHCYVDENRKIYLGEIRKHLLNYINLFFPATKQGHYDILNRQDLVEVGFLNKSISNDYKNKALEIDFKNCVNESINSNKRKTLGSTNYLDRIDAMEYAIYPFIAVIQKKDREQQKRRK